jgi:hypothetical protein
MAAVAACRGGREEGGGRREEGGGRREEGGGRREDDDAATLAWDAHGAQHYYYRFLAVRIQALGA